MKNIHPFYGPVIFKDRHSGYEVHTRSTLGSSTENPRIIPVEVTSDTHPAYTGRRNILVTGSAVDKFNRRYRTKKEGL